LMGITAPGTSFFMAFDCRATGREKSLGIGRGWVHRLGATRIDSSRDCGHFSGRIICTAMDVENRKRPKYKPGRESVIANQRMDLMRWGDFRRQGFGEP
jgi:hypothetical protein